MAIKAEINGDPKSFVAVLDEEENTFEVVTYVSITAREYRELCGKAALWDEYRADVERWCDGGDE